MKAVFVLALLLAAGDKVPVSGVTTVATRICGGPKPSPEMIEATKPRVDPGAHVRLYRGRNAKGEALEVKSDEKGQFSLTLPDGDWCVVDGRREHLPGTKPPAGADPKCWAEAAAGCDQIWKIEAQLKAPPMLALHFDKPCGSPSVCGGPKQPPP
jgi:hypothetical protein